MSAESQTISEAMRLLAARRWAATSAEQRRENARRMNRARWGKRRRKPKAR